MLFCGVFFINFLQHIADGEELKEKNECWIKFFESQFFLVFFQQIFLYKIWTNLINLNNKVFSIKKANQMKRIKYYDNN